MCRRSAVSVRCRKTVTLPTPQNSFLVSMKSVLSPAEGECNLNGLTSKSMASEPDAGAAVDG